MSPSHGKGTAEALTVVPYSIASLKRFLARKTKLRVVQAKLHSLYFENYFKRVGAKTIVIEQEYIDRDFLEDFAGYYVRCFPDYERKGSRLHFFDFSFSQNQFLSVLDGGNRQLVQKLQKGYLGFIVVKPLPETIIGRTCLATYPEEQNRSFPITRVYDANICGIPLTVKSLAYQEQDRVAAACATSALWSVFHGTGKLYHHHIPSPVEITQAANASVSSNSRSLPSQGLTAGQIAAAMRSVGLEPFLVRAADEYVLKSTLYAYLRGHVPVLLGIDLYDKEKNAYRFDGKHAVAVTGFRLSNRKAKPHGAAGFLLRASRTEKIYVHDDQVGPFARMVFDGKTVTVGSDAKLSLSTSWGERGGKPGEVRAVPDLMLVPLYHKIRIPYAAVHDLVVRFDSVVELARAIAASAILPERMEWDIFLTTVNEFKTELVARRGLQKSYKRQVLKQSMPKFLWRATARTRGTLVFDLLFDATDIEQGDLFVRAVEYDQIFGKYFHSVCKEPSLKKFFRDGPELRVIEWFADR